MECGYTSNFLHIAVFILLNSKNAKTIQPLSYLFQHITIVLLLHVDCMSIVCPPYFYVLQFITTYYYRMTIVFQPYLNCISTVCPLYFHLITTPCLPFLVFLTYLTYLNSLIRFIDPTSQTI